MKRNSLKIVCDVTNRRLVYYFKNEFGDWVNVPSESPFSTSDYTDTTMKASAKKILEKADKIYNRKNKGLDIVFQGDSSEFAALQNAIRYDFSGRDIKTNDKIEDTKIAILGKNASGKTTLVGELTKSYQCDDNLKTRNYAVYQDNKNHANWYEIKGIDIGQGEVERAFETLKTIAEDKLSAVIYCVSCLYGKLEDIEAESIKNFASKFHGVRIVIALTQCDKEDSQTIADEIARRSGCRVIQILAKDYSSRVGTIKSFGLDELSRYVFEGR